MAALGPARSRTCCTFEQLTKASDGLPYIADALTLANLSFLWRHAWLAKQLSFKTATEWATLLMLVQQDIHAFASPAAAWTFVEHVDHAEGLRLQRRRDQLAADRRHDGEGGGQGGRRLALPRRAAQGAAADSRRVRSRAVRLPDRRAAGRRRRSDDAADDSLLQQLNRDERGDAVLRRHAARRDRPGDRLAAFCRRRSCSPRRSPARPTTSRSATTIRCCASPA